MGKVSPGAVVPITSVEVTGEHRLRLTFRDGLVGDVDFSGRQWKGVFGPLRDPQRFARVSIEGPTIVWRDDGLDMAPERLYEEASQCPARKPRRQRGGVSLLEGVVPSR